MPLAFGLWPLVFGFRGKHFVWLSAPQMVGFLSHRRRGLPREVSQTAPNTGGHNSITTAQEKIIWGVKTIPNRSFAYNKPLLKARIAIEREL